MKKKDIRLYNVLFPVWMLVTLPVIWYIVIPGNFLVDSLVLIVAMKALKVENRMAFYRRHILPVFGLGFLADILGSSVLWLALLLDEGALGPYGDSPMLTIPALLLAGVLIWVFDYFISFRRCEPELRRKLAWTFAIATAPYTFLIPSTWVY